MTSDTPRFRLGIIAVVGVSLFAALFARLWYLQVLSAPDFRAQAQLNSIRTVEDPAPRGRILDRNGKVLVDNRASNVVAIDRSKLTSKEEPKVLAGLSAILGAPVEALKGKLESVRVSPYTPVPVAEDVPEEKMVRLLERADEFPAVEAKRVAVRAYPMGNLGAHLLGYVGEVTQEDIDASGGDYQLGDQIGKAGIEKVYEKDLRGKAGELKIEVDSKGRPIRVVSHRQPVQGDDVVLSINADVQRTAEDALAQGLASTHGRPNQDDGRPLKADAGAVVVLDTHGYVQALASNPTFDLPGLADGITTEESKQLFSASTGAPFTNRAIQGQYAPGSTWKLVTADAALRTGLVSPNFSLVDTGTYTIPGDCTGRGCLRHNAASRAYGRVGVSRALTVSSDVFFYTMGANFWIERQRFGENAIQDQAAKYGFGSLTGIPLPFESTGRVLTKSMKQALHDKNPKLATAGWYTGDNVNLGIGQAVMSVTPIQLANAYATFANGGTRYSPNVALRVQHPNGKLVREIAPRKLDQLEYPPQVHDPILAGLIGAVSDEKGTAYNAFAGFPLAQWGVAGKTGTAQATPKQDTALFVGFGPVAAPEYVVAVVMEQAGFGATAAAPAARKVFGVLSGLEQQEPPVQYVQQTGPGD